MANNTRAQRKPKNPLPASRERFAKVWNAAQTLAEAAKRLGLSPHSASTIASNYRRDGLALKYFSFRISKAKVLEYLHLYDPHSAAWKPRSSR